MQLRESISLKPHNTFGIDVKADYYVELSSHEEIISFVNNHLKIYPDYLILGGGSNILFINDFHGLGGIVITEPKRQMCYSSYKRS